jgi:hypothetical protein
MLSRSEQVRFPANIRRAGGGCAVPLCIESGQSSGYPASELNREYRISWIVTDPRACLVLLKWGHRWIFVESSQRAWCGIVGEFICIPLPVFGLVGRDPRFARFGGRLGWAGMAEHRAGVAAVSASRRDLR